MPDEQLRPWQILDSEVIIDSPYLRLRRDRVRTARGDIVEGYHVRESPGFVVVFAITESDEVVLVRQYKHGIGERVLELPAGAIEAGEDPRDAAIREFIEETGYELPRGLRLVQSFIIDPTNSTGRFSLFFAEGATPTGAQDLDPTEDITVELVPIDRLLHLVRSGAIDVNSHVASIYTVLDRMGRLGAER